MRLQSFTFNKMNKLKERKYRQNKRFLKMTSTQIYALIDKYRQKNIDAKKQIVQKELVEDDKQNNLC